MQFGAISILFRQTNVIWMLFFAANGAIAYVQDLCLSDYVSRENSGLTDNSSTELSNRENIASAPGLRRRRTNTSISRRRVVSESTKLYISEYSNCFN
jgi:alpha-1,2-glucosyltransferase